MAVRSPPAGDQDGPQATGLVDQQPRAPPPAAAARGHRLWHRPGPQRAGRARHRRARTGPRGAGRRGAAGQARLPDRSRAGTVTCPAGHSVADHRSMTGAGERASPRSRVQRVPAERTLLPDAQLTRRSRSSERRVADRRPTTTSRSRHRRAPPTDTAADRTAARAARPPLPRPQDPVHRQRQEPACRPPGRPPWSTSTRSATNWPPKPSESRRFPPQAAAVHRSNAHNARDRQRQPTATIAARSRPLIHQPTSSGLF